MYDRNEWIAKAVNVTHPALMILRGRGIEANRAYLDRKAASMYGEYSMKEGDHRDSILMLLKQSVLPHGMTALEVWQRDCDCAEWTTMRDVKPTLEAFDDLVNEIYEIAEGPVSIRVISPREVDDWEPYDRDRVLEAFENGRNYSV